MKISFAGFQFVRGMRGILGVAEQPKIPVLVPTDPAAKRMFTLVPSYDAEIYPMVFCVSIGVVLGIYSTIRHALFNPDISLSRQRRETPSWNRYKREDGELFSRSRHHLANLCPNPINTCPDAELLHEEVGEQ